MELLYASICKSVHYYTKKTIVVIVMNDIALDVFLKGDFTIYSSYDKIYVLFLLGN